MVAAFGGYILRGQVNSPAVNQLASSDTELLARIDAELVVKSYSIADLLTSVKSDADRMHVYDQVIDRIVAEAAPESWKENGRGEGELMPFPSSSSLVVSQTADVHQQIESILLDFRVDRLVN